MPTPSKKMHQNCIDFCVLSWDKGKEEWRGLEHIRPSEFYNEGLHPSLTTDSHVTVIFADADKVRECPFCRKCFTDEFLMPELWWSSYSRRSNGYFGSETFRDDQGDISALNTWSRFLAKELLEKKHIWHKFNIFTRWVASTKQTYLIVFESKIQTSLRKHFPDPLLINSHNDALHDPFWVYPRLLEQLANLQCKSVWSVRDRVRGIEKEDLSKKPNPRYRHMHDTARHAIHVSETLEVAEKTVMSIVQQHNVFREEIGSGDKLQNAGYRRVDERLLWYDHILQSLRHRASANKERLLNEVQLAFNSVAQYDSRIAVRIGRATQSDSAAMKTIAFVTLAFLPGTFISALFSMSFFNVDDDTGEWSVSKKIWMYWAIAIPVTLLTSGLWLLWQRCFPPAWIGEEEESANALRDLRRKIKRGDSARVNSYEMSWA
ncbi:hypothetical protein FLAG1_10102 [Fusarium langsethiae]|uniref:Uncharacterized protein n=1 Tax=Fusarium langsethiae TaxID=179993 RepID=A0A0M9EP99_FUSLA|nr:hypothetical protein FLAG1_10102 [Fusarium langsethiae]GKU07179.1 unnamed protein product [Fusarium langsethiae]GKU22463.1 unnamed protein product [Fusarium langsethiae]